MSKVTNAIVKLDDGNNIEADTFGNYTTIPCLGCNKYPILLIALRLQKGSAIDHPATSNASGNM